MPSIRRPMYVRFGRNLLHEEMIWNTMCCGVMIKRLQCPICKHYFSREDNWKHLKIHEKPTKRRAGEKTPAPKKVPHRARLFKPLSVSGRLMNFYLENSEEFKDIKAFLVDVHSQVIYEISSLLHNAMKVNFTLFYKFEKKVREIFSKTPKVFTTKNQTILQSTNLEEIYEQSSDILMKEAQQIRADRIWMASGSLKLIILS